MRHLDAIWTRPELKGGGFSAAKVYECDDFYVSAGGVSGHSVSMAHGNPMIVLFNFKFGVEVVGSDAEWGEWKRQATDKDKREFAYCVPLSARAVLRAADIIGVKGQP